MAILVYSLLPFLCVTVRRLHDTGRSGWWILLYLLPFIGWLVLLYFMVLEGDKGPQPLRPESQALNAAHCGVGSSAGGSSLG